MERQMTGMKPKDVTELNEVPLVESYLLEDTLPEDGLYHYLLQPGEEHDGQHKRATDRIWSKKTYRLSQVTSSRSNRVMYHLKDGLERVFMKGELMLIPKTWSSHLITSRSGNTCPSWIGIASS